MKRFVSWLLLTILSLFFASSACGETIPYHVDDSFSIRNGINFNMSQSEVKAIELRSGNPESKLYRAVSIAYITQELVNNSSALLDTNPLIISTTVAGENCLAIYTFGADGKANSLRYLSEHSSFVTPITDVLKSKYGTPFSTSELFPYDTKSINYYVLCNNVNSTILADYANWILEYDDIYILLEALTFRTYKDGYYYYENITYTPISYNEYDALLKDMMVITNNEQQSINNDL